MMSPGLVSVVMPAYNSELYIEHALRSVTSQTYKNLEIIVIDDCSTDNTVKIVNKMGIKNLTLIKLKKNVGVSSARNTGIEHSKGEYIALLDSDDLCSPDRIEVQVALLQKYPDISLVGSSINVINENDIVTNTWNFPTASNAIKARLLFSCPFATSSITFRNKITSSLDKIFISEYEPSEDYKLWTDLSLSVNFANISQYLVKYRIRVGQLSSKQSNRLIVNSSRIRNELLVRLGINLNSNQKKNYTELCSWKSQNPMIYDRLVELSEYILDNINEINGYTKESVAHELIYRLRIASKGGEELKMIRIIIKSQLNRYIPSYIINMIKGYFHGRI